MARASGRKVRLYRRGSTVIPMESAEINRIWQPVDWAKVRLKFCVWVTVRMAMSLKLETKKMGQNWEG